LNLFSTSDNLFQSGRLSPLIQSKRILCTPFFEIKLYVIIDNDIKNKNYNI